MPAPHPESHVLQQLEEYLLQPLARKSSQEVSRLLADEFIEFGSSGRIYNKQQTLAALQHETPVQRTLTNFYAHALAPDVALVTYYIIRQAEPGTPPAHSLRSSIWQFLDDRWQMLFHQGTPTQEPA
jgi:hypothetical protein